MANAMTRAMPQRLARRLIARQPIAGWLLGLLSLGAAAVVIFAVDLTPQVGADFFFSTDDPQLRASQQIADLFPAGEQLLLSATSEDPFASESLERLEALCQELEQVAGIGAVQSLTRGPSSPQKVAQSPLWKRLLLTDSPHISQLVVTLDRGLDGAASGRLVDAVEQLIASHSSPDFRLRISGAPYVVELIRRHLKQDLRLFSLFSLAVFGLVIGLVYRSPRVVLGTLTTCLAACAVTLALLPWVGVAIGPLTANLVTIIFVLTLSHMVFLTANWRLAWTTAKDSAAGSDSALVVATERTLGASFWAMATTVLGFSSLLLASAKPLRELGAAGALGTVVAIVLAYGLYPAFLRHGTPRRARATTSRAAKPLPTWGWPALALLLTSLAAWGLPKLDTDPGLLSYFAEHSEIRAGLEHFDRHGGSSPMLLVVRAADRQRLDQGAPAKQLEDLQELLETDPEVGMALSLPVLLAEARQVPFSFLLSTDKLLDLLDSERYQRVASSFITRQRDQALFLLRLRESGRQAPRREIIERLRGQVAKAGLELELAGGIYDLQAQLGLLVRGSLIRGLGGLLLLFVGVAAVVSRSPRSTLSMVLCLGAVPVLVLGAFGLAGIPLDVISSPAANVAIALGIDAMIHLVAAMRRHGGPPAVAWAMAREELRQPVLGAALILAAGFGIFSLSSFPPTQRFGLAVAAGTLCAALLALWVLPVLAAGRWSRSRGRAG